MSFLFEMSVAEISNAPWLSVVSPMAVPSQYILAPIMGSFLSLVTFPNIF
jgi:hypothetical protein